MRYDIFKNNIAHISMISGMKKWPKNPHFPRFQNRKIKLKNLQNIYF